MSWIAHLENRAANDALGQPYPDSYFVFEQEVGFVRLLKKNSVGDVFAVSLHVFAVSLLLIFFLCVRSPFKRDSDPGRRARTASAEP